ncbi:ets-domain-containing protein, partial [Aphelenchoides avenae]
MNKFLSEWKQRELLCPAIASSPPPAPLSSSTFPGFLQFGASGLTATACDAFESRCSNLTAATPTDGTISQFPSTTSALLAAALAQQQNNNNSSACTQISAEDQLGAFLRAAVAANSSAAAAAAANVNTTHHQNGLSGDSSGGASASTDAGGVGPPDANSQSSHQHLTNSLASAVAGNPFLSQPPHQSAFQLVRSAHQVVPHSLLQPNPLLQQQHSPQNPPPEIRIHQPQPVPQEVTTSQHMAAAAAALYPQLMCQALLDRLGPSVLRSHMSAAKPIPNNERMDLARFRVKEPQEWAMDDVVAWMLDVAKRHQIPFENFQMHKFATCTGPLLMLMNEQSFKERDPTYGSLLFNEFRKLLNDDSFVDDWMRAYKASEEDVKPSTSALQAPKLEVHQSMQNTSLSIPQGS